MEPSEEPNKRSKPNAAACLACRARHMKCDASTPICARCVASGSDCVYVPSRRGQRGETVKVSEAMFVTAPVDISQQVPSHQAFMPTASLIVDAREPSSSNTQSEETTSIHGVDDISADDAYMIGLYYRYIHPAHPFVLPQRLYRQNPHALPVFLKRAMCFIASHHASGQSRPCPEIAQVTSSSGTTNDAFRVQALILITLASYARFERDKGNAALNAAIALATSIKLNSDNFGYNEDDLFRESWRRTWWELYTITGLISLIGGTNVRLSQPTNMTVPCACELYEACQTSKQGNTSQFQQRLYAVSVIEWSSFAYRIEAMRLLATVLDSANEQTLTKYEALNASISSYLLSIPDHKSEGLTEDGEVDEVMSCALMIIHLAAICLNFPRSTLAQRNAFTTVCGTDREKISSDGKNSYSMAALRSARALTKLISLHSTLKTLSPCFACAMAFAAVVQLSKYIMEKSSRPPYLKENLQLQLSALQSLGEIWPIAHVVRSQLAQFLREVMTTTQPAQRAGPEPRKALDQLMPDEQWLQELMNQDMLADGGGFPFFGASTDT